MQYKVYLRSQDVEQEDTLVGTILLDLSPAYKNLNIVLYVSDLTTSSNYYLGKDVIIDSDITLVHLARLSGNSFSVDSTDLENLEKLDSFTRLDAME